MTRAAQPVSRHRHVGASKRVTRCRVGVALVLGIALAPTAAAAQSFDCAKAHDPVERAICASQRLRHLDSDLAAAYAAALKRDAAQADTLRAAQRSWAGSRAACLAHAREPSNAESADACLVKSYTERLAALQPSQPAPTQPQASITPAAPPTTPPPPSSPASGAAVTPATQPNAAVTFATPQPAAGLPEIPGGAATLERSQFPTAGETDILLHVTTPGRFAILAHSPTGTAFQLVDMLTGPGEREGWPGKQDGRIDALLDTGTYKVRAFGAPDATGNTTLSAAAFAPAGLHCSRLATSRSR
jgi:uncharacterized protein